ncbi:hypothetical protein CC1G_05581 [Coprinopsis cinerea okayama7|uniref:Uncharacterized protein n=1 Tax=Coprinopsis cinerea (strain Okayama-7 / 130 / ATCC MYA-4618 / FGSC 9003) TaxID=240176 RepID=A8P1H9_COPC7|nr:hypothetical protein CC1G_05581 [Coprinopsis cinerea okayama7\|eukprot:XP_001838100.1 hypothetical protein CC1G_05581 [Coprinopsis cinerea okayama7\
MEDNLPLWRYETALPSQSHGSKKTRSRIPLGREGDVCFVNRKLVLSRTLSLPRDTSEEFNECEFFESLSTSPSRRDEPITVNLADFPIRVMKAKGIKRDYEFVDKVQAVYALDDDAISMMSEEDWEEIFAETRVVSTSARKPYSHVVKGGGG